MCFALILSDWTGYIAQLPATTEIQIWLEEGLFQSFPILCLIGQSKKTNKIYLRSSFGRFLLYIYYIIHAKKNWRPTAEEMLLKKVLEK